MPPQHVDKAPVNYYARWAFIMGLISLTGYPFLLPLFLGPLDISLSIKAIRQLRVSNERGWGRAFLSLLIGVLLTLLILLSMVSFAIESPVFSTFFFIFLTLIGWLAFNFLLFRLIKKRCCLNKSHNKKLDEKRAPLDREVENFMILSFVFASLTLILSLFYFVGLGFGPITIMMAAKALKKFPKEKSYRKFNTILSLIIGIAATLAFLPIFYVTAMLGISNLVVLFVFIFIVFTLAGLITLLVTS